jgi:hypothetical protein
VEIQLKSKAYIIKTIVKEAYLKATETFMEPVPSVSHCAEINVCLPLSLPNNNLSEKSC